MNQILNQVPNIVLVLITGVYAWFTYRMLKTNQATVREMRAQREDMFRPYVVVSISLVGDIPIFRLIIRNTGKTAARNLRLSLDKRFYQFGRTIDNFNLKCHYAFNSPISYFPPEAELTFYLANLMTVLGPEADANVTPSKFTVSAQYEFFGREVTEENMIDLEPFRDASVPVSNGIPGF